MWYPPWSADYLSHGCPTKKCALVPFVVSRIVSYMVSRVASHLVACVFPRVISQRGLSRGRPRGLLPGRPCGLPRIFSLLLCRFIAPRLAKASPAPSRFNDCSVGNLFGGAMRGPTGYARQLSRTAPRLSIDVLSKSSFGTCAILASASRFRRSMCYIR